MLGLGVLAASTGGVSLNAGIADFGSSTAQPEMNSVAADPTTAVMHLALQPMTLLLIATRLAAPPILKC
jgi:hypothetical protein